MSNLKDRRLAAMGQAYRLFYDEPVNLVRGKDVWVYDDQGRKYLDAYNNVPHVGHCHPQVVEAVAQQFGQLNTHTRYLHELPVRYAERLLATFPAGLNRMMFACTGTEAVELALRMARAATGNSGLIVTENAYHGNSWAVAQISPEETGPQHRGAHVVTIPAPASEDAGRHLRNAIDELAALGLQPAALIIDTVMSSEGIPQPAKNFFPAARQMLHDAGGLFIADEVQAGFGRTGDNFWGFDRFEIIPDIVTMGKPMGNGYPVSGVVVRQEIQDAFAQDFSYFNTFGGSPVAAAAAHAVLDVMEQQQLQRNARQVGAYLRKGLAELGNRFDLIGEVRGAGLFNGLELVQGAKPAETQAGKLVNLLRHDGVLCGRTGPQANVLKFRPPMTFTSEHADLLLSCLQKNLENLS